MVVVHFDLETGSLKSNAAIYSIGAVAVMGGLIISRFHVRINPYKGGNRYRHRDNSAWWAANNPGEFTKIEASQVMLIDALEEFRVWLSQFNIYTIWQLRFQDFMWVENACDRLGIVCPIRYTKVRELHTFMEAKYAEYPIRTSEAHNALEDAIYQAKAWIHAKG